MFPVSDECITVSDEFSKKKRKKRRSLFFTQRFACHQPFLFSLQAFFLLRRCCPCPLHEVTVCRSPLASTNRKQDFLLSFLSMDLYHRCCPSRPNSRQPLGDDYLTKTIDYPPHPRPYSIMSRTLAQRHVAWCNILYIPHKKSVWIKLYSLTRH